jgi:protein TonB
MFKESLLESSNVARKDKRWPMTLAFVLELIAVSFLLIVPLMSTGVIPVLAHDTIIAPFHSVEVVDHSPNNGAGRKGVSAGPSPIVRISNNSNALRFGDPQPIGSPIIDPLAPINGQNVGPRIGDLMCAHDCITIARPPEPQKRVRLSHLSEAMLIRKVDPIYPRTAVLTHTFGTVKLHAIIAKDGTIQSLTVTSGGNPILAQAALDAVGRWRYRPYILNDEAVEVETFIIVNFRPPNN